MAISRKSAAEYAADLENSILSRNTSYDTKIGPISDIYIQPTANVLELQNERIRKVQQLLSLVNDGSFTDDELDEFVYNESIVRLDGSRATVTLIFSRSTLPTSDITVKANFPVATMPDEDTESTITFLTLDDATLVASNASSYLNSATQKYELQVQAQAVVGSMNGNVGPNRVVRPLRPLNGFDSVFNRSAAAGGRDRETNDQLIERYFVSLLGSSPTVVAGIQKILRDKFPEVEDSNVVYGNSTLNVRSAYDGGAVDVHVIGDSTTSVTETVTFVGKGQIAKLSKQPVTNIVAAGAYVQGTDFSLSKDTSGYAGSVRAADGIKWSDTIAATSGTSVSVTYTYNALLQRLQAAFGQAENDTPSRDLLFKQAQKVNVALTANIKVRSGYGVSTVVVAVTDAIVDYINSLKLGESVEGSDLQAVVRSFVGVDNFIIANLAKVGSTGSSDIQVGANEYARIANVDLLIVPV